MAHRDYSDHARHEAITLIEGGMSLRRTADQLGIPLGTVNGWWQRHRKQHADTSDTPTEAV